MKLKFICILTGIDGDLSPNLVCSQSVIWCDVGVASHVSFAKRLCWIGEVGMVAPTSVIWHSPSMLTGIIAQWRIEKTI